MLSCADPEAVKREMIARVKRQQEVQEELALTAVRKANELIADRKRMADEFNGFRMRMVSELCINRRASALLAIDEDI